jgi:hypothetical protein
MGWILWILGCCLLYKHRQEQPTGVARMPLPALVLWPLVATIIAFQGVLECVDAWSERKVKP